MLIEHGARDGLNGLELAFATNLEHEQGFLV